MAWRFSRKACSRPLQPHASEIWSSWVDSLIREQKRVAPFAGDDLVFRAADLLASHMASSEPGTPKKADSEPLLLVALKIASKFSFRRDGEDAQEAVPSLRSQPEVPGFEKLEFEFLTKIGFRVFDRTLPETLNFWSFCLLGTKSHSPKPNPGSIATSLLAKIVLFERELVSLEKNVLALAIIFRAAGPRQPKRFDDQVDLGASVFWKRVEEVSGDSAPPLASFLWGLEALDRFLGRLGDSGTGLPELRSLVGQLTALKIR